MIIIVLCIVYSAAYSGTFMQLKRYWAMLHGAENPKRSVKEQCGIVIVWCFLTALTSLGVYGICGEVLPLELRRYAAHMCCFVWNAGCLLTAGFLIWNRIWWRTHGVIVSGRVENSEYEHIGRSGGWLQTVRYEAEGETYTFSEKQVGMKAKPYQKGDCMPVRYLKEAPYAAECADFESHLPWLGALVILTFPAMMLYWYLTGE